jgi:hypothetical protein
MQALHPREMCAPVKMDFIRSQMLLIVSPAILNALVALTEVRMDAANANQMRL